MTPVRRLEFAQVTDSRSAPPVSAEPEPNAIEHAQAVAERDAELLTRLAQ